MNTIDTFSGSLDYIQRKTIDILKTVTREDSTDTERKKFAPLGTLFEASAWIFLDGIIAELMKNKKETEESMRSRHATLELP